MGMLCWTPRDRKVSKEEEVIEKLRCELPTLTGFWPTSFGLCAEKIVDSCDYTVLVSIVGTSQDGATLTVLGSCGPGAGAAPPGRVLPTPWALAADLPYKYECAAPLTVGPLATEVTTLHWTSGSQLSLPYEWHQLLGQTRFAEALCLHASLEPLLLGGRLVGALLLVRYAGEALPAAAVGSLGRGGARPGEAPPAFALAGLPVASAPFNCPSTWTGGGKARDAGGEGGGKSAAAAKSFLRRIMRKRPPELDERRAASAPSPALLRGLARALSQAAFGPHLRVVSRVCTAAQALASSSSLFDLASALSATISEALAAELHVNLAVRVAVVPPLHGQYGYLLPLDAEHAQVGLGCSNSQLQHMSGLDVTYGTYGKRTGSSSAAAGAAAGVARIGGPALGRALGHREDSFTTGHSAASTAAMSGPAGLCVPPRGEGRAAAAFPLPSSLLLQLLRHAANNPNHHHHRGGTASTASSVHAGCACPSAIYQALTTTTTTTTEDPTVRTIVTKAYDSTTGATPAYCSDLPSPPAGGGGLFSSCGSLAVQLSGASAGGGGGAAASRVASAAVNCVSGMVVANLNAWVQDVERPSSDVALLLLAARGRGAAAAGRPSHGGGGGGGGGGSPALGGGPSCLVAVAGSAPPRLSAVAAAAAASGSAHAGAAGRGSVKSGGWRSPGWVHNLEASMRGGVAVDLSMRYGGYGGGSVRYDSAGAGSYGPCVALYMTAQERLPASLLRAVKDRAQALLELLLPACLGSISMGPVRSELDLLALGGAGGSVSAAATAAAVLAGGSRSKRMLLSSSLNSSPVPCGGGGQLASGAATPSYPASALPSPSPSQHQLAPSAALEGVPSSTLSSVVGGAAAAGGGGLPTDLNLAGDEPRIQLRGPGSRVSSILAGAVGGGGGRSALAAEDMAARRQLGMLELEETAENGGGTSGVSDDVDVDGGGNRTTSATTERTSASTAALCREIHLIAHQRWPEDCGFQTGAAAPPRIGAAVAAVAAASPCGEASSVAAAPMTAPPSSTSRTTRGSPGSCGFGAMAGGIGGDELGGAGGGLAASRGTSLDVTGAMEDMVSSMRDNLDVWVNSFWEMLRESPAKGGHMHGSYADDDLRFLRLYQRLGSGGAASVYAGVLLGMDVAVKVIDPPPEVDMEALVAAWPGPGPGLSPQGPASPAEGFGGSPPAGGSGCESEAEGERLANLATVVRQAQMRELVRSARECAVLTTLSHPAIVQVYSYHTRVHVVPGDGPEALPRLVPVPPGEGGEVAQGPLHSVLVMERCDLGSLADALDNGMFKKAIIAAATAAPSGPPGAAGAAAGPARSGGAAGRILASTQAAAAGSGGGGGFTFSSGSSRPVSSSTGLVSAGGGGGGGLSAMRAIYLTLLELALALRHLHSLNLVHCDIKVANVLLKSSASDPRGFTCKLSDFGLVNLLRADEEDEQEHEEELGDEEKEHGGAGAEAQQGARGAQEGGRRGPEGAPARARSAAEAGCGLWMSNADGSGTVTHLAPECFKQGCRLDQSIDIYAFGIVMWEVFTRKPPYAEFAPDFEALPVRVLQGLRPGFPSQCPTHFRALAEACWSADPARRPSAAAVVTCLQSFLESASTSALSGITAYGGGGGAGVTAVERSGGSSSRALRPAVAPSQGGGGAASRPPPFV